MALCPHCMNQTEANSFCTQCGGSLSYQAAPHQLPAGTILTDGAFRTYEIGAVKGQGGFGITYIATDLRRKIRVALKEYFPMQCSTRAGIQVAPQPGMEQVFAGGQGSFLEEAKTLAALPPMDAVVQIMDYFEVNGTAYIAMEYLDGMPLNQVVQQRGVMPADVLLPRLPALMQNLHQLHQAGIVHRDISPDNIMYMPDGSLKLLDFGSARHYEDGKSVSIQLKHGFAPVEQYLTKGQGPFTDVYSLCATIYYCLTLQVPPHSVERLENDTLVPPSQLGVAISREQEDALLWGLTVQPKSRPQDMAALMARFYPGMAPIHVPAPVPPAPPAPPVQQPTYDPSFHAADQGQAYPNSQQQLYSSSQQQVYPTSQQQTYPNSQQNVPYPGSNMQQKEGLLAKLKKIPTAAMVLGIMGVAIVALLIVLVCLLAGGKKNNNKYPTDDPYTTTQTPNNTQIQQPETKPELQTPEETPETKPEVPAPEEKPEEEVPEELEPIHQDGLTYEIETGREDVAYVVGCDEDVDTIEIADEVDGYPVVGIKAGAFVGLDNLTAVAIPDTVETIDKGAFADCPLLYGIGLTTTDHTIQCNDTFENCPNLILIFLEEGCAWEGRMPKSAAVLQEGMETEEGTITDFEISDNGVLYGVTDDDELVLFRIPSFVETLDIEEDAPEGMNVVYMMEGALDTAHSLVEIHLADDMYYPFSMTEQLLDIGDVYYVNDSTAGSWSCACLAAIYINEEYGEDLMEPDYFLTLLSQLRATELVEVHELTRPDGSGWDTLLNEYDYDWYAGAHMVDWCDTEKGSFTETIADNITDFVADPYDSEGNPYTNIGCGIIEYDDGYYIAWFLTN